MIAVDFGFLCHFCQQEEGVLYARGIGFDRLRVPGVPCSLDGFYYVVQLRGGSERQPFRVRLTDADGGVLYELDGKLEFSQRNFAGEPVVRVIVGLEEVAFPAFGPYGVHFEVAGIEVHRAGIQVTREA
ncbi:MAG: hypothetical protein AB1758_28735 [Candidatus Eremiobacterota bacterium]